MHKAPAATALQQWSVENLTTTDRTRTPSLDKILITCLLFGVPSAGRTHALFPSFALSVNEFREGAVPRALLRFFNICMAQLLSRFGGVRLSKYRVAGHRTTHSTILREAFTTPTGSSKFNACPFQIAQEHKALARARLSVLKSKASACIHFMVTWVPFEWLPLTGARDPS